MWTSSGGSTGSLREVDRLEDALAQAQAQRLSAEAALSHSSTEGQGQVQAAQQALQAATQDLANCQARIADLEATNATLIQEAQVRITPETCHLCFGVRIRTRGSVLHC